jgi:hypothetical protein
MIIDGRSIGLERVNLNTNACSLVSSQLGAGHDRGRGPVDSVDHHRLCQIAGLDLPYLCSNVGPLTRAEWKHYVPAGMVYRQTCP